MVLGLFNVDGMIDVKCSKFLIEFVYFFGLGVMFYCVFDYCVNFEYVLEEIIVFGCECILILGLVCNVYLGIECLV